MFKAGFWNLVREIRRNVTKCEPIVVVDWELWLPGVPRKRFIADNDNEGSA